MAHINSNEINTLHSGRNKLIFTYFTHVNIFSLKFSLSDNKKTTNLIDEMAYLVVDCVDQFIQEIEFTCPLDALYRIFLTKKLAIEWRDDYLIIGIDNLNKNKQTFHDKFDNPPIDFQTGKIKVIAHSFGLFEIQIHKKMIDIKNLDLNSVQFIMQ